MISSELIFSSAFIIFILGVLLLDLGVFTRSNHIISFKESMGWTFAWIILSIIFYFFLLHFGELLHGIKDYDTLNAILEKHKTKIIIPDDNFDAAIQIYRKNLSLEFITGYVIEKALSVDNIFVMIMIFMAFGVEAEYYKKVLFWGIIGALVMRFAFIFMFSALIHQFDWILYVFGILLVLTGVKMFITRNNEEKIDPKHHPIVQFSGKLFNVHPEFIKDRFWIRKSGKLFITPLFITLIVIEFSDIIFAVDSVPAIFAITHDPFIVFFSNIFAILGLRALFFAIYNVMGLFRFLKIGLSVLLTFIGVKMLAHTYLESIGFKTIHSLYVIVGILAVSIIASLLLPEKKQ